jgi:hypothetical protein
MSQAVRKLAPGEVVIGFIRPDGTLIGEWADASIGHDAHSYTVAGLRSQLAGGQAIAVTIGKSAAGKIRVFGSGAFPPPGGGPLSRGLRDLASKLVE